ncbi:MAG: IclR family acetate operon transcriptional repressor [Paracoccaceae bacterium]|jgi:IclR family acetate operon transcriptional repressor
MSTVDKALDILDLFSEHRPAIGLSEAARQLKRDKASTLRYLNALESKGFIEQDPFTRSYHLGPALARLAMIREITYPVNRAARNILKKLVADTGETAHLTHFSCESLTHTAIEETAYRGTRVYIDPAEPLTLHATASGIAFMSRSTDDRVKEFLNEPLVAHTNDTPTDRVAILAMVQKARENGYASTVGTFETDVCGIAAPVFGPSGEVCGAVAVATPISRMTDVVQGKIADFVINAAQHISRHYGAKRLPAQDAAE